MCVKPRSFYTWIFLVVFGLSGLVACTPPSKNETPLNLSEITWPQIEERARGQTVYWNAWGGDQRINAYIRWVGAEVKEKYDLTLVHVKLNDTSEAVARILAEKAAGRTDDGTVDLIWINGENFSDLKANNMLFGPVSGVLPNYQWVDQEQPAFIEDFTIAVDGLQVPWGLSILVWLYDSQSVTKPPQSPDELLLWASENPGRFTYPAPPDFVGTSFLKQLLIAFTEQDSLLTLPVSETSKHLADPVFEFLDQLKPLLWREGRTLPTNSLALKQLLADGEVDFSLSFNPADGISGVLSGQLAESVKTYTMKTGALSNGHFVAIPQNASAKEGAMVIANFLLSPAAQAKKADIEVWGDMSALDIDNLEPEAQALFEKLQQEKRLILPNQFERSLAEPHPSWTKYLERVWLERYAQ
ncbi:ABC transporter substrate-binding protein [Alteromonadaceae bacterium M269]|nr:ABC transporter substrate-binding protein [Alteromonadaceae bacterium M269]